MNNFIKIVFPYLIFRNTKIENVFFLKRKSRLLSENIPKSLIIRGLELLSVEE